MSNLKEIKEELQLEKSIGEKEKEIKAKDKIIQVLKAYNDKLAKKVDGLNR